VFEHAHLLDVVLEPGAGVALVEEAPVEHGVDEASEASGNAEEQRRVVLRAGRLPGEAVAQREYLDPGEARRKAQTAVVEQIDVITRAHQQRRVASEHLDDLESHARAHAAVRPSRRREADVVERMPDEVAGEFTTLDDQRALDVRKPPSEHLRRDAMQRRVPDRHQQSSVGEPPDGGLRASELAQWREQRSRRR
jgi:hypothetical protein